MISGDCGQKARHRRRTAERTQVAKMTNSTRLVAKLWTVVRVKHLWWSAAYSMRNLNEMTARSCVASRVSTRSVLRKRSGATELTIQPIREEVRTFHGSQHTHSKLHSSRLWIARATTTQHKHSTELAHRPRCHPSWTPTVHQCPTVGRPWVARPHTRAHGTGARNRHE